MSNQTKLCGLCFNEKSGPNKFTSEITTNVMKLRRIISKWYDLLIENKIIIEQSNCSCGTTFVYTKTFFHEYCLGYMYYCRYFDKWELYGKFSNLICMLNDSFDKFYDCHVDKCPFAIYIYFIKNILNIFKFSSNYKFYKENDGKLYIDFKYKKFGECYKKANKNHEFDPEGRFVYEKETKRKYELKSFNDFLETKYSKNNYFENKLQRIIYILIEQKEENDMDKIINENQKLRDVNENLRDINLNLQNENSKLRFEDKESKKIISSLQDELNESRLEANISTDNLRYLQMELNDLRNQMDELRQQNAYLNSLSQRNNILDHRQNRHNDHFLNNFRENDTGNFTLNNGNFTDNWNTPTQTNLTQNTLGNYNDGRFQNSFNTWS
jgi:hypothetical protein